MGKKKPDEKLVTAYKTIVDHVINNGYGSEEDLQNLEDTPRRAASVLTELILTPAQIRKELNSCFNPRKIFPVSADPGIQIGQATAIGLCPHHLLPIIYNFYIGYLPVGNKVIGLSKIIRIARALSSRPVLQEQVVNDIADVLYKKSKTQWPSFETEGSIVTTSAMHSCMCFRGVRSFSPAKQAIARGVFLKNTAIRMEAYELMKLRFNASTEILGSM